MKTMKILGILLIVALSVSLSWGALFESYFFKGESSDLYPVDLIISDGAFKKEFKNVTYVKTDAPEFATYTCIYHWGKRDLMYQFELLLPRNQSKKFEVYGTDCPAERTRPYILLQELGTNANLLWNWDPQNNILKWQLSTLPGKDAIVGGWVDTNSSSLPDYAVESITLTCPSGDTIYYADKNGERYVPRSEFEIIPAVLDYACSPDPQDGVAIWESYGYKWWHYIGSGPVCPSSSKGNACIKGTIKFGQIESPKGAIGIRRALYDNALIDSFSMDLHSIDGTEYTPEFVYPQYVIPPGYYMLQVQAKQYAQLILPLNIQNQDLELIDVYPPRVRDLKPFSFNIAAQFFGDEASYSNLRHRGHVIEVDVHSRSLRNWWAYFVLPNNCQVKTLTAYLGATPYELREKHDYITYSVQNRNIIVCRVIGYLTTRLALIYGILAKPELKTACYLLPNYPNPFAQGTYIRYSLPKFSHTILKIYDVAGRPLRILVDGDQDAGNKTVMWDGKDTFGREVKAGIYFCELKTSEFKEIRKMILVR